jgi:hypothetical protein
VEKLTNRDDEVGNGVFLIPIAKRVDSGEEVGFQILSVVYEAAETLKEIIGDLQTGHADYEFAGGVILPGDSLMVVFQPR